MFFCCNSIISATVSSDTISFSGKKFVEHIVDAGESLNSIAKFYSLSTEDIKTANDLSKKFILQAITLYSIYLNLEKY